jgi:hypothetical protein|tara:strand:- start:3465 stop:5042 length:1578 start_codon:yes stop_codon:yes gene_type:complete
MATWKKVITEDNVENLATADLLLESNRDFDIAANKSLEFRNAGNSDKLMFGLYTTPGISAIGFDADICQFNSLYPVTMATPGMTMTSNVNTSAAGPNLILMRKKLDSNGDIVSGTTNDNIGSIEFKGVPESSTEKYAQITGHIESAANATASGSLKLKVADNNVNTTAVEILPKTFGSLTSLQSIKIYGETLASLVSTLAAADNSAALAAIQADVDLNQTASEATDNGIFSTISTLQDEVDANEAASDAAEAALQVLIDNLTTTVTALNTYTVNLTHQFSAVLKLIGLPTQNTSSNYGLASGEGVIFRHIEGAAGEWDRQDGYRLSTSDVTAILLDQTANAQIPGIVPYSDALNGVSYTSSIYNADEDIRSGRAGAWLSYHRDASAPAMTVRFHGTVWLKARTVPFASQKIRFVLLHRNEAGSTTAIPVASDYMPFDVINMSSEKTLTNSYTPFNPGAGNFNSPNLNKVELSFSKYLSVSSVAELDMFMLAIINVGNSTLLNSDSDSSVLWDGIIADIQMTAKPT